jgi:uncharacterized protein involved in exopolysaccharide biosynthesis
MNEVNELKARVSLRDVLLVVFSKKTVFLGIYVIIIALTAAIAFLAPPVYKVTAKVLVKPTLSTSLQAQAPPQSLLPSPVTEQDIKSEVQILQSPDLIRKVVEELKLYEPKEPKNVLERMACSLGRKTTEILVAIKLAHRENPVDVAVYTLQRKLDIKPVTLSNIIEISLRGTSAPDITAIVNKIVDNYIDYHANIHMVKGARQFFSNQADLYSAKLDEANKELEDFRKEYSLVEVNQENFANLDLLKTLREKLAVTQAEIANRQAKVAVQLDSIARSGDVGPMTESFRGNYLLQELVRVKAPVLLEKIRIDLRYKESSPKYRDIQDQYDNIQNLYLKTLQRFVSGDQLEIDGLKKYEASLSEEIKDIEARTVLLAEKQIELQNLERVAKLNEKNYLLYADKMEEARISEQKDAARVANVAVTNWAHSPSIPVFPKRLLMIVLALIVGLIVAVGGAFLSYYLDHTIKTPEDVVRFTHFPVLGSIESVKEEAS